MVRSDTGLNGVMEWGAILVAEDRLTDAQIAATVGRCKNTIEEWKRRPAFRARVQEHRQAAVAAIVARGIAERQNRLDALNDRWRRMHQVIDDRAADETMKGAGARTGLLVRSFKQVGRRTAEEYQVDTGLLKELRAHEQQAAQEVGEWTERRQDDVHVGIQVLYAPTIAELPDGGVSDRD